MNPIIQNVITSLEGLSAAITNAYPNDNTLQEIVGWTCPPLNRNDLASQSQSLSNDLKNLGDQKIDDTLVNKLQRIPPAITAFQTYTLPYLFNGNGQAAYPVYFSLIEWISLTIKPLFTWEALQDNKAMPPQLIKRLKSIQAELNNISTDKTEIEERINLINNAVETAESLPADLESLKEARLKIDKFSTDSAELYGKIDNYFQETLTVSKLINKKREEADRLVQQCEEAYKITTTKGLAAAFDQRAKRLTQSMWIWVTVLIISLALGSYIGSNRIASLSKAINVSNPEWGIIWMHIILSLLSIGAPIWLAWLATKQINQRFRLSEDYAFKASVAKAYEGYRKEAARIDIAFEARLFSSALSRLEEAPLRLVETDPHGSPWHELFSSPAFQKAINTIPEFKDTFIKIAKNGVDKFKAKIEEPVHKNGNVVTGEENEERSV